MYQRLEEDIRSEGEGASASTHRGGGGGGGAGAGGERVGRGGSKFFINAAIELTTCWIRDIYDE